MKKILITGAGGLVGKASVEHCLANGDEVVAYDRQALDIGDGAQVDAVISSERPDAVINCAAWTDVDGCERDPAKAERVNADGPENLARACRQANAGFLTISTDYVFDGSKDGFYTQRDKPHPLSVYGRFKLEGERRPQAEHARTIVVRTGYIFGPGGRNFLSTVVDRAKRGEKLKVITDSWGTPTYARDLAVRLRELVELDLPGIFHVVSAGEGASFETFTREALKLSGGEPALVEPVSMNSLSRPAPRPRNSKMKCLLSEAIGLPPLPHWQEGLAHFVVRNRGIAY
ncbi:MAG TPA: dTDP-4-dehydrorhamnose reductase [Pyrinomonadaceae bacterium]|nr:dTDP-4-dehydrorhamnose reductase [Pyrinomonadaceae bacterium]